MAIKYRYVQFNDGHVEPVQTTNLPYGSSEISFQDFIEAAKKQPATGTSYPNYYELLSKVEPKALQGGEGEYVAAYTHPLTGEKMTNVKQSVIDQAEAQAAGVKNGTLRDLGNGLTVPYGTTGEANIANIGTHNTANAANANVPKTQTFGSESGTSKYYQFAGSPDVFDQNGKYISSQEAAKIPNFFSQVQQIKTPRPEVKTGEDYATFSGKDISPQLMQGVVPTAQANVGDYVEGKGVLQTDGTYKPTQSNDIGGTITPSNDEIIANLKAMGLSDNTIKLLGESGQTMFAAFGEIMKKKAEEGNPTPQTFTQEELDKFFTDAQNDPTINQYYKDQLRIGQTEFQRNIAYLQGDYETAKKLQESGYFDKQKQLATAEAEAGRANSGFRQQAKDKLATVQSATIESSRRTLQKNLESLGSSFEQKYGSSNLSMSPIDQQSFTPYGNIAGQLEQNKLADIRSLEQQSIAKSALTRGLTT